MKVALLGPAYPYRGGIAHYTASLSQAFQKAGHQVRVYNFTRQYPRLFFPGRRQTDTSRRAIDAPSIRCVDSLNPVSWWTTSRRIGGFSPHLALVQWWHPFFAPSYGTIARCVRRRCGATTVFLCHNVLPHEASRLDHRLLTYAYGAADAFIVQSAGESERLRQLVGARPPVEVVSHPTYDVLRGSAEPPTRSAAREQLGLPADARVLLFFGLVRRYKGLSVLLDAMPKLRDPNTILCVAGEFYEDPASYRDRVDRLGLAKRVRFEDRYIPNEEVPAYFSAADLVVLPYRTATQSGIVQVAYAFDVPVVVSAVGGIPEVVEDGKTGLLVPPERPDRLAQAIDRFFDDDMDAALRAGIAERRPRLSWARVVETSVRFADPR